MNFFNFYFNYFYFKLYACTNTNTNTLLLLCATRYALGAMRYALSFPLQSKRKECSGLPRGSTSPFPRGEGKSTLQSTFPRGEVASSGQPRAQGKENALSSCSAEEALPCFSAEQLCTWHSALCRKEGYWFSIPIPMPTLLLVYLNYQ